MERIEPNPEPEERRDDPETGLEGSIWRMELSDDEPPAYPVREGRPDCSYYMRTGRCGYGDGCRYNHPRDRGKVVRAERAGSAEHLERPRSACMHFVKHGTCRYGDACKYEHPKQDEFVPLTSLNKCGYPLRSGEKDCSYYVRMGCCKFGLTCKYNHPEPSLATLSLPASSAYTMVQRLPLGPSVQQYPVMTTWEFARQSVLSASLMQAPYSPVLLFPGIIPDPSFSAFPATVNLVTSSSGEHATLRGESESDLAAQISCFHPSNIESYLMMASSVGPSTNNETENLFPERLDNPECQECKQTIYSEPGGSRCKYHRPDPQNEPPEASRVLNSIGCTASPHPIVDVADRGADYDAISCATSVKS